ncbi:MAG: hypothetical protein JNK48_34160 [Bryobacterales bacterium]|nr:hypothetical protein [Bryobacterales bacterium]
MSPVIVLAALAPLAWGEQVELAHPANPSFARSLQSPAPLAVGMRVGVRLASRRCLEGDGWKLRLYPLGSLQGYEASIIGARTADGCTRELDALLPHDIPMGVAEAVLTDSRDHSSEPQAVRLNPVQFALLHNAGRAMAQRMEGGRLQPLSLTAPARAGDRILVRAAGLGRARAEEVRLRLAQTRVRPLSVRAVAGEPGLEEIEFEMPANLSLLGCYVPLATEVNGVEENVVSIPVAGAVGPCRHQLGLTEAQLLLLDTGGRIPLVEFLIDRNFNLAVVSSGMAGSDLIASSTGHDQPPLQSGCQVSRTTGGGVGDAVYYWEEQLADKLPLGDLELTSPDGSKENPRHERLGPIGVYFSPGGFGPRVPDPGGVWQLRASNGDASIDWRVRVPPEVQPEELDPAALLAEGGIQQVRWNGGDYLESEWMIFRLRRDNTASELVCAAPAPDGRMSVDIGRFLKIPSDAAQRPYLQMSVWRQAPLLSPLRIGGTDGVGITIGLGRSYTWVRR